jgi:transposase
VRGVQEELIKYFWAGVTARLAAQIAGVNPNTAILFYHKLREVIFAERAAEAPELMRGEIEVDERYFGGHWRGKRGRGAAVRLPCLAS